ncbi:MAG: tRNA (N(6)-L-threonylcarbamoyladenosine(37)-C(2))-methylthiotransferase MtaB [Muribaculaceae bacterium]|nr:tRNA (N(6)-L-threonylcarbamoyladenosine(37)-C(2))-methylthiotransferase MtaB [Muribaculaceae bacterium]
MIDFSTFDNITALYHTFGCKLNFAETSTIARQLAELGVRRVSGAEQPDIIVVNTCSVTELADKKCRQTIRSFHKRYPDAAIVATGCYAQLKSTEVAALPGVAVVAGIDRKMDLAAFIADYLTTRRNVVDACDSRDIREFRPSCSRGDRTRFFLKVQDGCDYWCTYCTIPRARGRSRSGTIDSLVAQAAEAAAAGGREIVITGVNIGDFGKGRTDTFFDLIRELDRVEGIDRYRISSIEPNLLTDDIIDWVARDSRAFMPHFHIPLQAGSDEVLRLMHRHYDTVLFRHKIERIRESMPHAFIGVDLITGARGESPELFEASRAFVDSLDISRLHVFPYSERPSTRALDIDGIVSQHDKHLRTNVMLRLSEAKWEGFARRFIDDVRPVLLEHPQGAGKPMAGFTDNYLRVEVDGASSELDNRIVNVKITGVDPAAETMQGILCDQQ